MVIIPSGWASHSRKRERSFIGEPLRGSHILHTSSATRACARFALRAEKWFLAHFWAVLEPRYGHLKAFLGPKMTKTRSKQPKTTPNHPQNGQKWCRNIFGKIDFGVILGSFWGHFGSFWVILGHLGHFEPKKWPNVAYNRLTWPQTTLMARKMAQNRIFFLILYGKYAFLRNLPSRISK